MFKNPFGPTTVDSGPASTAGMIGEGVEVRYSPIARTLVPGAMLLSGIMVPVILYFVLPSPFSVTMAVVTAVMELLTAVALWAVFNLSFVRADEIGVTRSLMGRKASVSWTQINKMEVKESAKSPQTHFQLKDRGGKILLEFSDLGNRADGVKLHQFIQAKLKRQ